MSLDELEDCLRRSFADHRLSRGERSALAQAIAAAGLDERQMALLRSRAVALAREALLNPDAIRVLDWLDGVLRLLERCHAAGVARRAEVWFSPGDDCPTKIAGLINAASRSLDICVFTITHDRLSDAIVAAYRRGVAVRIITDNEKLDDPGSDVRMFAEHGIPVRIDRGQSHMHHKFAIFDDDLLLTGSYNWTRGAARDNEENVIVTDDARLVARFRDEFARLWDRHKPLHP